MLLRVFLVMRAHSVMEQQVSENRKFVVSYLLADADDCINCPPGECEIGGCTQCPVGTSQPQTNQTQCIPCMDGFVASDPVCSYIYFETLI